MEENRVKGKIAFISGASSGIGKATAEKLAQMGVNLILCARRENILNELKENLEKQYGIKVKNLVFDVRNYDDVLKNINSLDDEWVWARIANIYFDLERYEDALKAYNRAYELEGAYKEGKDSLYICSIGRTLRRLGRYEEAVEKLLESRRLSLEEGDVVDLEDLELAYCYAVLGNKEKAEEHMKLSIDSLGTYAESEEYLKKQFDEIREMINVLSHPS